MYILIWISECLILPIIIITPSEQYVRMLHNCGLDISHAIICRIHVFLHKNLGFGFVGQHIIINCSFLQVCLSLN